MAAVAHASPADLRRLSVAGTVARPAPAATPTARTYRRRRALALVLVLTAVAVLGLVVPHLLGSVGGGLTATGRPDAPTGVYVVRPGDTFWDIARRIDPAQDPRPLVAELVAAHGSPVLLPGERLRLPGGD